MPEHPMETSAPRPVHLKPFDHQVGGHNSVLRYNEGTLCKPLIPREQLFYETLPAELKEFTPEYRGTIEVQLHEDSDGYIKLVGYPVQKSRNHDNHRDSNSPNSSGSDSETVGEASLSSTRPQTKSSLKLLRAVSLETGTQTEPVNPWSLRCHKQQVARMREDRHNPHHSKFILLENVAAHFRHPCILDLKMGPRQHGDDATVEKRQVQVAKCAATTSVSLGLRLCGMQVFQQTEGRYINRDKFFGRSVLAENFKDCLCQFLNNGQSLRTCVIEPIVERLRRLYTELSRQQTFRFYSSSLLIMYDGDDDGETTSQDSSEENANNSDFSNNGSSSRSSWGRIKSGRRPYVEIKMIDFAHATRQGFWDDEVVHKGPDSGYLFGLKNLIQFFKELQEEFGNEDSS